MARRKKKAPLREGANILTEKCGDWKKGDTAWFESHGGDWVHGKIMYFSEHPTNGRKWVTFWDLMDPQYKSAELDGIHSEAPSKKLRDKVLRRITRNNIKE